MSQDRPRNIIDPCALTAAEIAFLGALQDGARDLADAATRLGLTTKTAYRRSGVISQKLGAENWRKAVAVYRERAA